MAQEPLALNDDAGRVADPLEVPDTTLGDDISAGLQALASAVPVVGGPLGIAIDRQRQRYVGEKQAAFQASIAAELKRLGKTVDDLSRSFFGTMTYAAWLSTLSNEQDKVNGYTNAVINTALPDAPR
jgi:hypothetical protein